MSTMSRRRFIRNASIGAAAAGTAVALPGLVAPASAAPLAGWAHAAGPAAAGSGGGGGRGPIVAHIVDASTGQVAVMFGNSEVIRHDPALVQALLQAAR
jgi:hypothetical protein